MLKRAIDSFAVLCLVAAIVITVGGFRSISTADALVIHGPAGRPAALVTSRGILYLAVCNVPVWSLQQSPVDLRKFSNDQLLDYRDTMVLNANQQIGYTIIPPTPGTMAQAAQIFTVKRVWLGFSIGKGTDALNVSGKWFVFASAPVWAVVPLLLVPPVRRVLAWNKHRKRVKHGQCLACGYDLRESKERCPECGFVFVQAAERFQP